MRTEKWWSNKEKEKKKKESMKGCEGREGYVRLWEWERWRRKSQKKKGVGDERGASQALNLKTLEREDDDEPTDRRQVSHYITILVWNIEKESLTHKHTTDTLISIST